MTRKEKDTDPWAGLSDRERKKRARRFVTEPNDLIVIRLDGEARQEVEQALQEQGKQTGFST